MKIFRFFLLALAIGLIASNIGRTQSKTEWPYGGVYDEERRDSLIERCVEIWEEYEYRGEYRG